MSNRDPSCQMNASRAIQDCAAPAKFIVAVGTRASDEQASCARHLAMTCEVMLGGELSGRRAADVRLTVRMVSW